MFTVKFETEMGEIFEYRDIGVTEVAELVGRWVDETIVKTEITLQD